MGKALHVVGYHLNCLDEPVFMAGPKPVRTKFGIPHRLESCEKESFPLDSRFRYREEVSQKSEL